MTWTVTDIHGITSTARQTATVNDGAPASTRVQETKGNLSKTHLLKVPGSRVRRDPSNVLLSTGRCRGRSVSALLVELYFFWGSWTQRFDKILPLGLGKEGVICLPLAKATSFLEGEG